MEQPGSLWELKPAVRVLCQIRKRAKSGMGKEFLFFSEKKKKKKTQTSRTPNKS